LYRYSEAVNILVVLPFYFEGQGHVLFAASIKSEEVNKGLRTLVVRMGRCRDAPILRKCYISYQLLSENHYLYSVFCWYRVTL